MTLKKFQRPGGAAPATAAAGPGSTAKKMHILYVEDEDVNWEVTQLHLRERYDVVRAKTSREAFNMLTSGSFHAILMDIELGGSDLNGVEITQVLRGTYKGNAPDYTKNFEPTSLPIIFMTAYAARYSRKDLLAVGGDDLVTKPIDFTHLALCLSRCLLKNVMATSQRDAK